MRNGLLLVASLFLTSATGPEIPKWSSDIPPLRWQATGTVQIIFVPSSEISKRCNLGEPVPEGMVIRACTQYPKKGRPIIIMPDPCERAAFEWYAKLQCHENAHALKNWKHERD